MDRQEFEEKLNTLGVIYWIKVMTYHKEPDDIYFRYRFDFKDNERIFVNVPKYIVGDNNPTGDINQLNLKQLKYLFDTLEIIYFTNYFPNTLKTDTVVNSFKRSIPALNDTTVEFPCKCNEIYYGSIGSHSAPIPEIIVHLNDTDKWTREQIADWLDTLDVDLSFKIPTEG